MIPRLGINIDHVATLRQARGEIYPSLRKAAKIALENGADQITIHLREDRRHIQDIDVPEIKAITTEFNRSLNFEMGAHPEIVSIAEKVRPEWVCLVPEKREERTTEGGLNLYSEKNFQKIKATCGQLKDSNPDLKISLFLEAKWDILEKALSIMEMDAVEIHTGDYANHFNQNFSTEGDIVAFLKAQEILLEHKKSCHAGHGLTLDNMQPLLDKGLFEEYNIGHWVIGEAIFEGLGTVVSKLKKSLQTKKCQGLFT